METFEQQILGGRGGAGFLHGNSFPRTLCESWHHSTWKDLIKIHVFAWTFSSSQTHPNHPICVTYIPRRLLSLGEQRSWKLLKQASFQLSKQACIRFKQRNFCPGPLAPRLQAETGLPSINGTRRVEGTQAGAAGRLGNIRSPALATPHM